jgi:hypothetical protein
MTDFFDRLAEHALNPISQIQPLPRPTFAPHPAVYGSAPANIYPALERFEPEIEQPQPDVIDSELRLVDSASAQPAAVMVSPADAPSRAAAQEAVAADPPGAADGDVGRERSGVNGYPDPGWPAVLQPGFVPDVDRSGRDSRAPAFDAGAGKRANSAGNHQAAPFGAIEWRPAVELGESAGRAHAPSRGPRRAPADVGADSRARPAAPPEARTGERDGAEIPAQRPPAAAPAEPNRNVPSEQSHADSAQQPAPGRGLVAREHQTATHSIPAIAGSNDNRLISPSLARSGAPSDGDSEMQPPSDSRRVVDRAESPAGMPSVVGLEPRDDAPISRPMPRTVEAATQPHPLVTTLPSLDADPVDPASILPDRQLGQMADRRVEPHVPETRPAIKVTIGRVELRAAPAPPPLSPAAPPAQRGLSLAEYLKRRSGGVS